MNNLYCEFKKAPYLYLRLLLQGQVFAHLPVLFRMEISRSAFTAPSPQYGFCKSILPTIENVIDLHYLCAVAIRSHLLSMPYWKGKHSWRYSPKYVELRCSFGTLCLVLSRVMDGVNLGYTFTQTHPTCSSMGGGWE